jgi:hypothetical protein
LHDKNSFARRDLNKSKHNTASYYSDEIASSSRLTVPDFAPYKVAFEDMLFLWSF